MKAKIQGLRGEPSSILKSIYGGNGSTTVRMYSRPQNRTLKGGKFYVRYFTLKESI